MFVQAALEPLQSSGIRVVAIPGRLAYLCSITTASSGSNASSVAPYCGFRDYSELGQMQACPNTVDQFRRSCSQLCHDVGCSNSRENKVNSEGYKASPGWPHSELHYSPETLG